MTTGTRTFTPAEANRTLPLVRRIVRDIVTLYPVWKEHVETYAVHAANASAEHPDPQADAAAKEVQRLAAEIEACLKELTDLGVEYKQPMDGGLVDFPGEIDGAEVYLCWKYDEPEVAHFHSREEGFAGRRPLVTAGKA